MSKLLFTAFFIIFYNGTIFSQNLQIAQSLTVFNLENEIENKREILYLSSICKSVSYIKLETNPNCLIKQIQKVIKDDNLIFVADIDRLLVFDITGKYIIQIGANGRGPGEYLQLRNFCLNPDKKEVYVLDDNKILVYDYSGKSLNEFRTKISYLSIGVVNNEYLAGMIFNYPINTTNNWQIEIFSREFKHKNYLLALPQKLEFPEFLYNQIYSYGKELTYWQYYDYTLYRLTSPDKIIEKFRFEFGHYKFSYQKLLTSVSREEYDKYYQSINKYFELEKITESRDNFFLSGAFQRHLELYFVDKKTSKCQRLEFNPGFNTTGFINDLDGGITFWPMGSLDKDTLYCVVEMTTLLNDCKNELYKDIRFKQDRILEHLDSKMINNNPWIMLVSL